jgi:hypothetical protein
MHYLVSVGLSCIIRQPLTRQQQVSVVFQRRIFRKTNFNMQNSSSQMR